MPPRPRTRRLPRRKEQGRRRRGRAQERGRLPGAASAAGPQPAACRRVRALRLRVICPGAGRAAWRPRGRLGGVRRTWRTRRAPARPPRGCPGPRPGQGSDNLAGALPDSEKPDRALARPNLRDLPARRPPARPPVPEPRGAGSGRGTRGRRAGGGGRAEPESPHPTPPPPPPAADREPSGLPPGFALGWRRPEAVLRPETEDVGPVDFPRGEIHFREADFL